MTARQSHHWCVEGSVSTLHQLDDWMSRTTQTLAGQQLVCQLLPYFKKTTVFFSLPPPAQKSSSCVDSFGVTPTSWRGCLLWMLMMKKWLSEKQTTPRSLQLMSLYHSSHHEPTGAMWLWRRLMSAPGKALISVSKFSPMGRDAYLFHLFQK